MRASQILGLGALAIVAIPVAAYLVMLRPDIPYATLEQRYASPTASHYLDLPGGVRVHYRDEGNPSGPVLMLVHGYSASSMDWDGWVKALGDRYRIIAPDLPGHGLTRSPKGFQVTPAVQVGVVDAVAQRLNLGRFVIAGSSMGGGVAWRYALAHPDRVSGLVLVDAAGWPPSAASQSGGSLIFALMANPVSRAVLKNLDNRPLMRQGLEAAFYDPALVTDAVVTRYFDFARAPGHRDILTQDVMGDFATPERLAAIHVPTLVMVGENDLLIPASDGPRFANAIPGAKLILYPGVGHVPMEQIPERSAGDLRTWLAEAVPGW